MGVEGVLGGRTPHRSHCQTAVRAAAEGGWVPRSFVCDLAMWQSLLALINTISMILFYLHLQRCGYWVFPGVIHASEH